MLRSVDKSGVGFHHVAARIAGAQIFAAIEFTEARQEVLLDVGEFEVGVVQLVVALVTEPHQTVFHGRALALAGDDGRERNMDLLFEKVRAWCERIFSS